MKALKEPLNLLFLVLAAVVFLTIAPLQSIKAGFYNSWTDADYDSDIDFYEYNDNSTTYVDMEADVDENDGTAYCYAYVATWSWAQDGSSAVGWVWANAWAYVQNGWTWEGSGTPPGGTLSYTIEASGHLSVNGWVKETLYGGSGYGESYADCSAASGSAWGEGWVSNYWGLGHIQGGVSADEGEFIPIPWYGEYHGYVYPYGWSVEIEDEDIISPGTTSFYVEGSTDTQSYAYSEANSTDAPEPKDDKGEGYGCGMPYAEVSLEDVDFTSN